MQATMFCIALIRAQMRPSAGILRTDWMIPPVTMSAVPMVSSTNPQKIPACMIAAPGSLNIFDWTKAYSARPSIRAGTFANGRDGRATAKRAGGGPSTRRKNAAAPQKTTKTIG